MIQEENTAVNHLLGGLRLCSFFLFLGWILRIRLDRRIVYIHQTTPVMCLEVYRTTASY